jgi:MFS family permease
MNRHPFTVTRARLRRGFRQLTWGGEWAIPLPAHVKHNLYWFFFDGVFASVSDNIIATYLVLYFLALGATRTQIGLLSSFSSFSAALILLPGALLVERIGRRKQITLTFGGGIARLAILVLAFLPILVGGPALVWVAIALSVLRDTAANLAFPAWMDMTASMVPIEGRGRYFGSRNFVMGIAGMLVILLAGELITRIGQSLGYRLAMLAAFAFGAMSTFSYSKLKDPTIGSVQTTPRPATSPGSALQEIKSRPAFLALCFTAACWNFSLNIAGPFFNVYMVENLKFTASMVGITAVVSSISSLLIQRKVGELSDRWGPRRVQLLSMLLIPILPAAWLWITRLWHVVLLNSIGGALWGAFNLVSFNYLLMLIPEAQRPRYSAIYQIVVLVALAFGAALGAWVATRWGYAAIFVTSAAGRLLSALLFAWLVKEQLQSTA